MRTVRSRRALSPVIVTVILVSVAITAAVVVVHWMGGVVSGGPRGEKVEILTGYSTRISGSGWRVTLDVKNTGPTTSTLIKCFVNDVPVEQANYGETGFVVNATSTSLPYSGTTIESGESAMITIWIHEGCSALTSEGYSLTSGTMVEVKLHSAPGMNYIKIVELV